MTDLLSDDAIAALEKHGEVDIAERMRRYAERRAEEEKTTPKSASTLDAAIANVATTADGRRFITQARLLDMTARDIATLKATDRELYTNSLDELARS